MNKISDLKVGDQVVLWNGGKIDIVTEITFCGGANLAKSRHIHENNVNWQKTNELNNKQMEFKIAVPQGFEIDKEKSTFEKIVFKEIENKLPMSVEEIPNRYWYIGGNGSIGKNEMEIGSKDKNNLSTKERAEAFLALMQLVELRDAYNGDWEVDWIKNNSQRKYVIEICNNYINSADYLNCYKVLHFKSEQLRDQFAEQFKDLIETAKELL